MADTIGVFVTGDRELAEKFEVLPGRMRTALVNPITRLTAELYARIESVIPRKTGKLAGSLRMNVTETDHSVTGTVRVGAGFAKAAALEYGAHAAFTRKAHSMRLDHVFARKLAGPLTVSVPSGSVTPNIAARNYLRGPEAEMAGEVASELRAAIDEATAGDQ